MQVAPDLHVEWVEGEAVVLNMATGQLHYLNPSAALVFALIQEKGYAAALAELEDRFGADSGFQGELSTVLLTMRQQGLLLNDAG
jgi:hypothetical protein